MSAYDELSLDSPEQALLQSVANIAFLAIHHQAITNGSSKLEISAPLHTML